MFCVCRSVRDCWKCVKVVVVVWFLCVSLCVFIVVVLVIIESDFLCCFFQFHSRRNTACDSEFFLFSDHILSCLILSYLIVVN